MKTLQDYIDQTMAAMAKDHKPMTAESMTTEVEEAMDDPKVFRSPRGQGFKPGEEPAYLRKSRGQDFPAKLSDEPADEPAGDVRPEDIPAVQRKAAGKDFPVTQQQLDEPRGMSDLRTLQRLAGLK